MSEISILATNSTDLANHVGATVRLSNDLDTLLQDCVREDLSPQTRLALFRQVKSLHDDFRKEHFRGMIASLNTVVAIVDGMYQAEPADGVDAEEPLEAPFPGEQIDPKLDTPITKSEPFLDLPDDIKSLVNLENDTPELKGDKNDPLEDKPKESVDASPTT